MNKLILKGILFYITMLSVVIFILAIDSIYDNECLIPASISILLLGYFNYKVLSIKELEIITGINNPEE